MTMLNKCLTGKATTYDQPRLPMLQILYGMVIGENVDFAELIWEDFSLGNLKFTNKGAKDLVFGMAILNVMLSDEIKDSNDYSEYLAKSSGTQPVKGKGKVKGLITKKDLEVALNNIRVPKKKRTKTLFEESAQSEGVEDDVDSKEIEEEDEIPLVRRKT
ncbi:hypothetical protein Tco_0077532 [Tanacetum coccineum]